ncbi:MAG: fibronectin type III domain-containing protein [Firmicutes bacterium]|nr:fibronectin type III domain-containing protein [Bacillota bacterium]
MDNKEISIRRCLFCLLLSFAMVVSLVPSTASMAFADTTPGTGTEPTDEEQIQEMLELDKEAPSELATSQNEVYGVDNEIIKDGKPNTNTPFLLSEQSELALLYRDNGKNYFYQFDNFNMGYTKIINNTAWVNGINVSNAKSYTQLTDTQTEAYDTMKSVQSIGFDRDGSGRKTHTASIGFSGSNVLLVIQNAATGGDLKIINVGAAAGAAEAPETLSDNYLAITAGDYDKDGKDSVVVYFPGDGDNAVIKEYYLSGSDWVSRDVVNLSSVLKNTTYISKNDYRFKPVVSLATGDFTGDDREQLAFSAGFYNTSDSVADGYKNYECTDMEYFATCVEVCDNSGSGWKRSDPIWMYDIPDSFSENNGVREYAPTIMHAGVIAAGDVDNNGIDEIVAAGYRDVDVAKAYYSKGTDGKWALSKVHYVCNWAESNCLVSSVIHASDDENSSDVDVEYYRTNLQAFEMSRAQKYTHIGFCKESDWAFPKLSMACAKTNGNNSPEDVFISGIVYNFENYSAQAKFTPDVIGGSDLEICTGKYRVANLPIPSAVNWIRSVAVGNFDGNVAGREQFVFTLWQKARNKNNYSANLGVITGVMFNDLDSKGNIVEYGSKTEVVSYGPPEYYACNLDAGEITNNNYPFHEKGDEKKGYSQLYQGADISKNIFAVPVAVDTDDDGVLGRFRKNGYVYTDPQVLAVLEAGPFFDEIDEAGGGGGASTSYSVTTSFASTTSRSDNVSFEAGFAGEIGFSNFKTSLELGYTMDWSHSYETEYSVSTGYEVSAADEDIVLISRVPHLVYTYDVWNSEKNEWIENGYSVKVPLAPYYYTLGVDEYNDFVDDFNNMMGDKTEFYLKKIVMGKDLPKDHIGNPDKYWSNWSMAGTGGKALTDTIFNLGYSGDSSTITYEDTYSTTEGTELSHGFHYGLTVQGGADLEVAEFWAGGYVNLDYSQTTGHSITQSKSQGIAATVDNISAKKVNGLTEAQVRNGYYFTWTCGKWTRVLTEAGDKVPFYGFVVTNVKRRALPPDLGELTKKVAAGYASFNDTEALAGLKSVLTVEKIGGESKITYDPDSRSIKVEKGLAPGKYEAEFKISNGLKNEKYTENNQVPFSYDTTFKYVLTVKGSAPNIEGPSDMYIEEGYDNDASSEAFTIIGTPEPEITLDTFTDKISFDQETKTIKVAPGLLEGEYRVVLRAINSLGEGDAKEFTVKVNRNFEKDEAMRVSNEIRDLDLSQVTLETGMNSDIFRTLEETIESYRALSNEQLEYLGQAEKEKIEKAIAANDWIIDNDVKVWDAENYRNENQWQIDGLKSELTECYNRIRSEDRNYIDEFLNQSGYDRFLEILTERYESLMRMDTERRMILCNSYDGNAFFDNLLECDLLLQKAYFMASGMGDPENEEVLNHVREDNRYAFDDLENHIKSFAERVEELQLEDDFEEIIEIEKDIRDEYLHRIEKEGRTLVPNLTTFTTAEKKVYALLQSKYQNQLNEMLDIPVSLDNAINVTILINELVGGTALTEESASAALVNAKDAYENLTEEEKELVSSEAVTKLENLEELAVAIEEHTYDIGSAAVTSASKTYTGKALKPTPEVVVNEIPLKVGVDFTAEYNNNTNAGTATIFITGTGFYKGNAEGSFTIKAVKLTSASMSKTEVVYNGKAQKPTATVKAKVNGSTKTLKSGTDYTISYSNNKDVGKAKVTIKGKGNFTGSLTKTFKINPKGTTIKTPVAAKKAITVKWAAQKAKMSKTRITGYQIMIATNKAFTKGKKTVTVSGYSKTSKKITGLKAKTKYFIKVRTYKTVSGTKYYSKWSTVKTATAKA